MLLASLCLGLALALGQESKATDSVMESRELWVMGTSLQIRAIGEDRALLDVALDEAVAEIQRVEDLMTDWRPSELMDLNAAAGSGPQRVPAELAVMIARGLDIGRLTGGAFDLTYAGAGKLWDFKSDPPRIPDAEAIRSALTKVGYDRVSVDLEANTVDLPEGMVIGLGGIAKGYGVDRAMAVLLKHGIKHGIVNAGGDLKALGRKHDQPWEIAIKHPRRRDHVIAVLPVSNTCVVTSGDYERFFEHGGRRYHHIIDPRTGQPSTGCMSATVMAPDAAFADALATAMCVLGPKEGMAIIETLDRVEAMLVDMQGEVHYSSGLHSKR